MSDYYYFLEPPAHAERWRGVTLTEADDAKSLKDCELLVHRADDDPTYDARCVNGEFVFYYDYPYALMAGHIYSEKGMDEFNISRCCEYHFDEWTKEDED